jgi:hypothetical protein
LVFFDTSLSWSSSQQPRSVKITYPSLPRTSISVNMNDPKMMHKQEIDHRDLSPTHSSGLDPDAHNRDVIAKLRNPLEGITKEQMFRDVEL